MAKQVKEEETTEIISNEDLAYIRKKYAKLDMMPVETITQGSFTKRYEITTFSKTSFINFFHQSVKG